MFVLFRMCRKCFPLLLGAFTASTLEPQWCVFVCMSIWVEDLKKVRVCVWVCWALGLHGNSGMPCPSKNVSFSVYYTVALSPVSAWAFPQLPFLINCLSVHVKVQIFRIFWSNSVLGWWHGTNVASSILICPQRACLKKWQTPASEWFSHTLTQYINTT